MSAREPANVTAPLSDGRQPNSRGCFICGLSNPMGLKMVFEENRDEQLVYSQVILSEDYRSYPGVVHGGIVATILDETSGRALIVHTGDPNAFFATARIEIKYRRATPTNTLLVAVGWVERMSQGRAWVRGELRVWEGQGEVKRARVRESVLAECRSLVVRPQDAFLELWDEEAPSWRVYTDQELDLARSGREDSS